MKIIRNDDYDDDKPVGRLLTRREVLVLLGGSTAALIVGTGFNSSTASQGQATATPNGTALPSCVVKPELTEGPYFVDEQLQRIDIRIDPSDGSVRQGIPLHIVFNVSSLTGDTCAPLAGAQIDVWNCDAVGVYSGVSDAGFETVGQKWLRGFQVTDENGKAEFITIYPGWYSGRATHVHFKIRTDPENESGYEFTSQFFFPDELSDVIYAEQAPYNTVSGERDTTNATDMHYADGGDQLLLALAEVSAADMTTAVESAAMAITATPQADVPQGYMATFAIALDLNDAEAGDDDGFQQGGPGGGNPPGGPPPGSEPTRSA